jgi:hypothetical protein
MGALLPLALSLAPEIGKWLFGTAGASTAAAVVQAVQTVTGATDDTAAAAALARDPTLASTLRLQLAQIAATQEEAARQADLATLTAQNVALPPAHLAIAYGPPLVSLAVLVTFGVVLLVTLTNPPPAGSATVINMLLGTLAAMATNVVGYWVGSSVGSARKDAALTQPRGA